MFDVLWCLCTGCANIGKNQQNMTSARQWAALSIVHNNKGVGGFVLRYNTKCSETLQDNELLTGGFHDSLNL